MKSKIEIVKSELKELKSLAHKIESMIKAQKTFDKLKNDVLSCDSVSVGAKKRFVKKCSKISLEKAIDRYADLAIKYSNLIKGLSDFEQAIFIECYINGSTYTTIALKFNYSEEGIRKRLKKIIVKIAERYVS